MNELLTKIKSGQSITKEERNLILSKLEDQSNNIELGQSILAYGLTYRPTDENITRIEKFLDSNSDIIISNSIRTLCSESYWGRIDKYIEKLKFIIEKKHVLQYSESQIVSFSVLGPYLKKKRT